MFEFFRDLKVFGTFHLIPIRDLVGYNEKFQPQEVVAEVVKKVVENSFVLELFWGYVFIEIFCILYVDKFLLHIVRPHL